LFLIVLLSPVPFTPPPLPFNPQFSPFTAYYLTYPYWHAILSRVCQAPTPNCSPGYPVASSLVTRHPPLFLHPFSFQSLVFPPPPSSSHGTLHIPFMFLSLPTLSVATGGYTPCLPLFSTATRFDLFYFPPSILFLFNYLQNAPPATPLF